MGRRAWLAAALAVGLLPAGCGGDGEKTAQPEAAAPTASTPSQSQRPGSQAPASGGVEDQLPPDAQVDLAIKAVLASGVPGLACRRYSTRHYVKSTFGSRAGCIHSTVPGSAAESVEVRHIDFSGDTAEALAIPTGGPSDGERIKVQLVRVHGVWEVDSLRSNAPVGP